MSLWHVCQFAFGMESCCFVRRLGSQWKAKREIVGSRKIGAEVTQFENCVAPPTIYKWGINGVWQYTLMLLGMTSVVVLCGVGL